MRVALIAEQVDVRRGGAETSTVQMAEALRAAGVDVTFVLAESARTAQTTAATTEWPQIRVAAAGATKAARTRAFLDGVERLLCERRFDISHALVPVRGCSIYQPRGGLIPETVERTLAVTPAGWRRSLKGWFRRLNHRQRMLARREMEVLSAPDGPVVACVSQYVARQIEQWAPRIPRKRIAIVFNGVAIAPLTGAERERRRAALRLTWGVAPETPLLGFLAHNYRLKGLRELLVALAQLARETSDAAARVSPALMVVGRGSIGPWRRLASRFGVADQVHFVGALEDPRDLLAAIDALVHPTWYDPCSRVVLESLALGVPVLTTRWNGAAEIMREGTHGFVVDSPRDAAVLAAGIARVLHPEVAQACRDAANQTRPFISMEQHAAGLLDAYRAILATLRSSDGSVT